MADRLKPGDADLLILPEAPSPVGFEQDAEYRASMERLASRFKFGLVFNNIASEDSGDEHRYFNSAYFMNPNGELCGRYDKIHLVPFGEYIPLKRFFAFAQTISRDVGDFSPGKESRLATIDGQPANAIICFEAVFPNIARRMVLAGSRLIINLTNDAWYGASAAPYQHLLMTRWRALENRRFLLRATNSGISAIIDPLGRVQVSTGILREEICVGSFAFIGESSFYSLHGDWFPRLCAMITIALLLYGLVAPFRNRAVPGA
jgi:apolipoprotein N-acyltransferase